VQIEVAGQFMLGVLDVQAAGSPPSGRDPGQQLGPEADLRVGPASRKPGPASSRSSTGDPVLTAPALAASRGCPPGGSYMTGVVVVTGHLLRLPGQPAAWPRKPGVLPACPAGSYGADLY